MTGPLNVTRRPGHDTGSAQHFRSGENFGKLECPSSTRRQHNAFVGFVQLGLLLADGGPHVRAPADSI